MSLMFNLTLVYKDFFNLRLYRADFSRDKIFKIKISDT